MNPVCRYSIVNGDNDEYVVRQKNINIHNCYFIGWINLMLPTIIFDVSKWIYIFNKVVNRKSLHLRTRQPSLQTGNYCSTARCTLNSWKPNIVVFIRFYRLFLNLRNLSKFIINRLFPSILFKLVGTNVFFFIFCEENFEFFRSLPKLKPPLYRVLYRTINTYIVWLKR